MTVPPHRAQLLVCHQQIAVGHQGPLESRADWEHSRKQFCELGAYAWCFDDDMYVCDIHLNSRHRDHDHYVEFPTVRRRAAGPAG